ncbi:uncharacterized protein [Triticum aestivum]|uniref:uncharacterized protein n=1 Tax=Triticum aestivum TaxID=4565 RepID=UPI001D028596|nr:uncharacterized protein LOC123153680 [Triticum aestivum]
MAAQMLRRWKSFYGAFDLVDAAIEAADPDQFSRHVFRRARGDLVGRLCSAADDDQAERICGILDDFMGESLETLRLVPSTPGVPISTELADSVCALRDGWEASVQVTAAMPMKKLLQPKATVGQQQQQRVSADPDTKTKRPPKIEKMEAAKRKLRQGYQEAEEAKRRRRTQLVQATPKTMQPIRRCGSSMVKKTLSIRTQLHMA